MIKRIFKTMLIFSLCLSFLLKTNAAVSVSDGSAFLTKSELQSSLNNISNRMAQLENSLDAKIDSLVSSYLTRNGIWNGKKVAIDQSETHLVNSDFITTWTSWADQTKTCWTKSALIEKTGMCVTIVHIEGVKASSFSGYRCYLRYFGGTYTGFEDDVKVVLWMKEKIGSTSYGRNSLVVAQSQQRLANQPDTSGTCVVPMPLKNDFVLLGFVSKDNTLELGLTEYTYDFQAGDTNLEGYAFRNGCYLNIYVADCNIY